VLVLDGARCTRHRAGVLRIDRLRSPDDLVRLAAVAAPSAAAFEQQVRELLDARETRPDWWFVAVRDGTDVGRLCARADAQDALEMSLFGLVLPWDEDPDPVGGALATGSLSALAGHGLPIDARLNAEVHDHLDARRRILEQAGFEVFQEKVGYAWEDHGAPIPAPNRLRFRSLDEIGRERFLEVFARGPEGTLDRNDHWYWTRVGPRSWAETMLLYGTPADEPWWKVGYDADDRPIGYVLLAEFDEEATGTIVHIGVLPEHRGNGYVHDLLARAAADARERGFRALLSDTDVLNRPMRDAFERAGHRADTRPWHVWHLRWWPAGSVR
jgi:ribosomal protein S18 acetylase RimI-like enzyme